MTDASYNDLIVEAFIEPIRSVLIVDDDYPTLREVLLDPEQREKLHGHKAWNKSATSRAKVRAVIDEFREPDAPYILDIHDAYSPGEEEDEAKVGTLQQTDLLVLDYQLDKSKEGDGSAAVRIARQALTNKHFNLILVHTQNNVEDVFYEFLIGFMTPYFTNTYQSHAETVAFAAENEGVLHGAGTGDRAAPVNDRLYANARKLEAKGGDELRKSLHAGTGPWGRLKAAFEELGLARARWLDVARHALGTFEVLEEECLASEEVGLITWNDAGTKFIRASRGFVAFKSKGAEGKLLPALREALWAWQPMPSRLTLTKLRAEMNRRGIEVQDDALGDRDVGAVWYLRLLKQDERNLDTVVDLTVRNHSEQLLDQLLPEVSGFAKRMRLLDADQSAEDVIKTRFGLDFGDPSTLAQAKLGHNAFVGSKPINSVHLELGHILKIGSQFWVCMSPACDMVPKVHRGKPLDRMDFVKRFTALRLVERSESDVLSDANRGGQIFANIRSQSGSLERRAFSAAPELGASPAWMTMYVQDDGYLKRDSLTCVVNYVTLSPSIENHKAPVIAQEIASVCGLLRYEYALEIQTRFISSQSRIGLDFEDVPLPEDPGSEGAGVEE